MENEHAVGRGVLAGGGDDREGRADGDRTVEWGAGRRAVRDRDGRVEDVAHLGGAENDLRTAALRALLDRPDVCAGVVDVVVGEGGSGIAVERAPSPVGRQRRERRVRRGAVVGQQGASE